MIKETYDVEYTYQSVKNILNRLNIPISNYFHINRENKKNSKNIIENYENIPDEYKSEICQILKK